MKQQMVLTGSKFGHELLVKLYEYKGKYSFQQVEITAFHRKIEHISIGLKDWKEIVKFIDEQLENREEVT